MKYTILLFVLVMLITGPALGKNYFVASGGDDAKVGTEALPFRTIKHAADVMRPGDTCYVRAGTYRETIELRRAGRADAPIRFQAYPGEHVLLNGTDPIEGEWALHRDHIHKTRTKQQFEQLFVNRQMMLEARWPNTTFDNLLTREGWAASGPRSAYQTMHDPKLAKTGIDWTGAMAMLNVAHQFWTWSRPVLNHRVGSATFDYKIKMNEFHSKRTHWWADDSYYLTGKLEALDSSTEWFLGNDGTLYLWPPGDADPSTLRIEAKVRDYGFHGDRLSHVTISGFHFFACTFALTNSDHCLIEDCHLRFPSFTRGVPEAEEPPRTSVETRISGADNTIRGCSLAYCGNAGIQVKGRRNTVEDCLIHDVNWSGTLRYVAIQLAGDKDDERAENVARHNTIYNVGNTIITSNTNRYGVIEYNHVHHGGLLSKDVSLIYTSMPYATGNEIRYNWVHDSLSPDNSLGIRGDDKTRGMRVHHNVVWNVRRDGIIVKGGKNAIYNNTCFANGASDIVLVSGREPDKWWQKWVTAYEHQNEDSLLVNNCANVIVSARGKRDPGLPGDHSNNDTDGDCRLVDLDRLDFRPRADSPLVDAGRVVAGVTAPFKGKAPDIGAYEFGGTHWMPGHRNAIRLTRDGGGALCAALAMPVVEPIAVSMLSGERSVGALEFTCDNWFKSQLIPRKAAGINVAPLRFRTDAWGVTVVADIQSITRLNDARLAFERPDMTSAKRANVRFHYEDMYRSAQGFHALVHAFKTDRRVTVDGRLDSAEWPGRTAANELALVSFKTDADSAYRPAGSAYVLFDDENLYVSFAITLDDVAKLKQAGTRWGVDDGVVVDLRTVVGHLPGPRFLLQGFPSGKFHCPTDQAAKGLAKDDRVSGTTKPRQLAQTVQYAARIGTEGWTAEFLIPWRSLGVVPKEMERLRFNVGARCGSCNGGPWFGYERPSKRRRNAMQTVLLLRPTVLADATNLIQGGSFESPNLKPGRLTSNSRESIPKKVALRVREGRDCRWCLKLECLDAAVMSRRIFKWTYPVDASLPAGQYVLAYDVRLRGMTARAETGGFNSYIRVAKPDSAGRNLGQQESRLEMNNLPWTRREFILSISDEDKPSMLSLQLHNATGTVWIDNVSLRRCDERGKRE